MQVYLDFICTLAKLSEGIKINVAVKTFRNLIRFSSLLVMAKYIKLKCLCPSQVDLEINDLELFKFVLS